MPSELQRIASQLLATCREVTGQQAQLQAASRAMLDASSTAASVAVSSSRPEARAAAALLRQAAESCARAAVSLVHAQSEAEGWVASTVGGAGGSSGGGEFASHGAAATGGLSGDQEAFRAAAFRTSVGTAFYTAGDTDYRSAAGDVPPYPGEHVLDLHGTSDSVVLADGDRQLSLGAAEFAQVVRDTGWSGQPVRLFSCDTGGRADGFAQQLADELGVVVTAPTKPVWSSADGSEPVVTDTRAELVNGKVVLRPVKPPNGTWQQFHPRGR